MRLKLYYCCKKKNCIKWLKSHKPDVDLLSFCFQQTHFCQEISIGWLYWWCQWVWSSGSSRLHSITWRSSKLVSPIRLLVPSSHIVRDIWHTHIRIQIHLELLFLSESYGALLFSFFSCIFMYKVCINKSETQSWVENDCCIEDSRIKIRIICNVLSIKHWCAYIIIYLYIYWNSAYSTFFFLKLRRKKKAKWNVQALRACLILYDRFHNIIVIPKESSINCYCRTYYYIEIWPLELS